MRKCDHLGDELARCPKGECVNDPFGRDLPERHDHGGVEHVNFTDQVARARAYFRLLGRAVGPRAARPRRMALDHIRHIKQVFQSPVQGMRNLPESTSNHQSSRTCKTLPLSPTHVAWGFPDQEIPRSGVPVGGPPKLSPRGQRPADCAGGDITLQNGQRSPGVRDAVRERSAPGPAPPRHGGCVSLCHPAPTAAGRA